LEKQLIKVLLCYKLRYHRSKKEQSITRNIASCLIDTVRKLTVTIILRSLVDFA